MMNKVICETLYLDSCWFKKQTKVMYDKKSDSLYFYVECIDYNVFMVKLTEVSKQPVKTIQTEDEHVVIELQNAALNVHMTTTNSYEKALDILCDALMNHREAKEYRDLEGYQRLIWQEEPISHDKRHNYNVLRSFNNDIDRRIICIDIGRNDYKVQSMINSMLMFTGDIRTQVSYWDGKEECDDWVSSIKMFKYGTPLYNKLTELEFSEKYALHFVSELFYLFSDVNKCTNVSRINF